MANGGNNTIEKFSSTGTYLGVFASSGLNGPLGLAFDSAGNLYAANANARTIEKFSSTGTDLGAFAVGLAGSPQYLAFTDDAGVPLKLANQVPEPATWALLGLGLPALLGFSRRRKR